MANPSNRRGKRPKGIEYVGGLRGNARRLGTFERLVGTNPDEHERQFEKEETSAGWIGRAIGQRTLAAVTASCSEIAKASGAMYVPGPQEVGIVYIALNTLITATNYRHEKISKPFLPALPKGMLAWMQEHTNPKAPYKEPLHGLTGSLLLTDRVVQIVLADELLDDSERCRTAREIHNLRQHYDPEYLEKVLPRGPAKYPVTIGEITGDVEPSKIAHAFAAVPMPNIVLKSVVYYPTPVIEQA